MYTAAPGAALGPGWLLRSSVLVLSVDISTPTRPIADSRPGRHDVAQASAACGSWWSDFPKVRTPSSPRLPPARKAGGRSHPSHSAHIDHANAATAGHASAISTAPRAAVHVLAVAAA